MKKRPDSVVVAENIMIQLLDILLNFIRATFGYHMIFPMVNQSIFRDFRYATTMSLDIYSRFSHQFYASRWFTP